MPNISRNSPIEAARLAITSPMPSSAPPRQTTTRVPNRSDSAPHISDANPMQRKSTVAALETAVRDQPVAIAIGCRKTPSDIAVPNPMQVIAIPAPTMTQP